MNIDPSIVASSTLSELGTRAWHTMQLLTVTVLKLYKEVKYKEGLLWGVFVP